jgi:hypothetical protein
MEPFARRGEFRTAAHHGAVRKALVSELEASNFAVRDSEAAILELHDAGGTKGWLRTGEGPWWMSANFASLSIRPSGDGVTVVLASLGFELNEAFFLRISAGIVLFIVLMGVILELFGAGSITALAWWAVELLAFVWSMYGLSRLITTVEFRSLIRRAVHRASAGLEADGSNPEFQPPSGG